MRVSWLFVLGIAALACKDKGPAPAAKPAEQAAPAAPTTPEPLPAESGAAATRAVAPPSLDVGSAFDAEQEDAAWAGATEKAIAAAAPELGNVECRKSQCRATLTAATEADLVARAEKIQEALPSTKAKNVLLAAPEIVDGKRVMTMYVRYDR